MTSRLSFYCIAISFILFFSGCQTHPKAEFIELPILFSDHMVLQQNGVIPIWGKATPNKQVIATFKNQRSSTIAQEDSTWRLYLAPEPAGGPYKLSIIGTDTLTIDDVLVGEVWIGSGQSNMQWSVQQSKDAESEIPLANYPNIRLFSVDRTYSTVPEDNIPSNGWKLTTPSNTASFSAVAYYFGRTLHDSLDVPIGLIHSSWGGTPAEAWTSGQTLLDLPDFKEAVVKLQENTRSPGSLTQSFDNELDQWYQEIASMDPGFTGGNLDFSNSFFTYSEWPTMTIPGQWEQNGLPGFDGLAWLTTRIDLPDGWQAQGATLSLGPVDDADITWINGVEVGRTSRYNARRTYTVPAQLLKTGQNRITLRVLDTGGGGGIYGAPEELFIESENSTLDPVTLQGNWRYKRSTALNNLPSPPRAQSPAHTPSVLYNAMIHPLIPYKVKGIIWYQGESNASRAFQYRTLFSSLINDWRTKWNDNIAFHFVQLANFQELQNNPVEEETWPELREAQTLALTLPNTGMAVTIDIGEADDIHPRNKQDVGYRLALNALHKNYEAPIVPAGPLYQSMEIDGDSIKITFDNAENGLITSDEKKPTGFAIAAEDQIFHWAQALIRENTVIVFSRRVSSPAAVRYGWANNPIVNLQNAERLPASPFRTDEWPGITEGNK
ncbi:MAG: sialate O-acetylesterase [Rhodothermaceae bacterium]|nr:sialate O-acetylesterase [Rhodothermaceae bacterium]